VTDGGNRFPLRRLFSGPPPAEDRVLYTDLWFRGHNNARWVQFLSRLQRVDRYHFVCSDRRLVRALQFRALMWTKPARHRLMLAAAHRRGYRSLLANDKDQIAYFPGRVIADCDDPKFTEREVELLNRPNVAACVMVTERMARRYQDLGVEKPYELIPHGVDLSSLDAEKTAEVARRHRADGQVVVGYQAAWLLARGDRHGDNPMFSVDHLLDMWEGIRSRVPGARLWLLGTAGDHVRRRCEGRPDIVLFGRLPPEDFLSYVANFDIALYPRTADHGTFQTTKVVEYMGCGVPTVAYDYEITSHLREAKAGLVVKTPAEFVDAVERLARDEPLRRELGTAARVAGAAQDYEVLARDYAAVLDRHL
jgi:glycosyltransferase involved in cell wall biosynthesis